MHYGQSRRSPRTVANGTRGPHRGQGRREMKRGVNSLRQALRPPTSPIHTHSRVSCHCPIAALPVLPRPHAERPRHRSLLSGRMDLSKGRDVQCDGASADEHRRRGYRLPRTTCARPRRTWVPVAPNPESGSWLSPFSAITVTPSRGAGRYERRLALSMGRTRCGRRSNGFSAERSRVAIRLCRTPRSCPRCR